MKKIFRGGVCTGNKKKIKKVNVCLGGQKISMLNKTENKGREPAGIISKS
jgi:hypothetical protein